MIWIPHKHCKLFIFVPVSCPDDSALLPFTVLIPNTRNCSKFFLCSNSYPVEQSCPPGLIFSAKLSVCDYPKNDQLPENYCEYGDMLYEKAHYCDCTKYVICNYGEATVMNCPEGYHRRSKRVINFVQGDFSLKSMCKKGDCSNWRLYTEKEDKPN